MLVVAIVIVNCVRSLHLLLTMMGCVCVCVRVSVLSSIDLVISESLLPCYILTGVCVCVLESLFKFYRLSYI